MKGGDIELGAWERMMGRASRGKWGLSFTDGEYLSVRYECWPSSTGCSLKFDHLMTVSQLNQKALVAWCECGSAVQGVSATHQPVLSLKDPISQLSVHTRESELKRKRTGRDAPPARTAPRYVVLSLSTRLIIGGEAKRRTY